MVENREFFSKEHLFVLEALRPLIVFFLRTGLWPLRKPALENFQNTKRR